MAHSTGLSFQIEVITNPIDVETSFDVIYQCFGIQAPDGIFKAMNPNVDSSEGRRLAAKRLVDRWHSATTNKTGTNNSVFLKAFVSDLASTSRKIVGLAIWVQVSYVSDHGDLPTDLSTETLEALYPNNPTEQRYLVQLDRGLHRQRAELAKHKAETASDSEPPAIFVLDLCVVHPEYQGHGIATKLVQWGLDEAVRRGGLECATEGSPMGRRVYKRLGFVQVGGEIDYGADEEFAGRDLPSNVFMRTMPGT